MVNLANGGERTVALIIGRTLIHTEAFYSKLVACVDVIARENLLWISETYRIVQL